jgi:phosphoglycolate phosphatase
MAVCTNQAEASARALLRVFALSRYFKDVVGRDTFKLHKPDPMPLVWLMGRCAARPEATLLVGDSDVDVQCARQAGTAVVLMEHGYGLPQSPAPATTAAILPLRAQLRLD